MIRHLHTRKLPDDARVTRYEAAPESGPRLLFFTGGTALRELSRRLKRYTHNSVHLVTPFDSGGSSASLRRAFDMPSVGDLRNRLVALADESSSGNPHIHALFSARLPADDAASSLKATLDALAAGTDVAVSQISEPMRHTVQGHLRALIDHLPADFDLRGASLGNLVLTGGFLASGRDIHAVLAQLSDLAHVRGTVLPVTDDNAQLAAELADGTRIVGQHLLTGKEAPPISAPIADLRLVAGDEFEPAIDCEASARAVDAIANAELICFPMGSFHTSILANLLPRGIGRAVAAASCPKIYIPNTGSDPEQLGLPARSCVDRLLDFLRRDAGAATPTDRLLNAVLVDSAHDHGPDGIDAEHLAQLELDLIPAPLVAAGGAPWIDAELLAQVLVSLVPPVSDAG